MKTNMKKSSNIVKARQRVTKHNKIHLFGERLHSHALHFCNVATPHGLIHLIRPNRTHCERLFWVVCIILVAMPCVIISQQALHRYLYAPVVNTILRDYQYWEHTFPGFTLCPAEIFDPEISEEKFQPIWDFFEERGYYVYKPEEPEENVTTTESFREPDNDYIYNFTKALILGNIRSYEDTLGIFKDKFGRLNPKDYILLNNVTAAIFQDEIEEERFSIDRTITEYGICFTINSILANYSTIERYMSKDMSLMTDYNISDLTPLEEDPIFHISKIQMAVNVFIHSFNEIIAFGDRFTHLKSGRALNIDVTSEKHTTSEDVRHFSVTQRHCRFTHESNLEHSPVYSFNLCQQECKIQQALKYCNCLPFYYRTLNDEKICDIDGMICVSHHRPKILDQNNCEKCLRQCENEVIIVLTNNSYDWMFTSELTFTYRLISQARIRLDTIYSETDFLVQIGGLAGLAYGVGLLSVMEILYFLTLRLWFALGGKRVKAYYNSDD